MNIQCLLFIPNISLTYRAYYNYKCELEVVGAVITVYNSHSDQHSNPCSILTRFPDSTPVLIRQLRTVYTN